MSIMILPSQDGFDYAVCVSVPEDWTEEQAIEAANRAIEKTKTADPDMWEWEALETSLNIEGLTVPEQFKGPVWD